LRFLCECEELGGYRLSVGSLMEWRFVRKQLAILVQEYNVHQIRAAVEYPERWHGAVSSRTRDYVSHSHLPSDHRPPADVISGACIFHYMSQATQALSQNAPELPEY
jgi:hypothetical protein